MFNISFLSSLGKKTELQNRNGVEVLNFCKSIGWLQECKNYYHAYRSDEHIDYEDYWYLDLSDISNRINLNVFTNYIYEDKLYEQNLSFIVTLSWYEFEKTGWFTKLITGKHEKKVWEAKHANNVKDSELKEIIKWFVSGDLRSLNSILTISGEYQFDVD